MGEVAFLFALSDVGPVTLLRVVISTSREYGDVMSFRKRSCDKRRVIRSRGCIRGEVFIQEQNVQQHSLVTKDCGEISAPAGARSSKPGMANPGSALPLCALPDAAPCRSL